MQSPMTEEEGRGVEANQNERPPQSGKTDLQPV